MYGAVRTPLNDTDEFGVPYRASRIVSLPEVERSKVDGETAVYQKVHTTSRLSTRLVAKV